jgi:hypothetical protein
MDEIKFTLEHTRDPEKLMAQLNMLAKEMRGVSRPIQDLRASVQTITQLIVKVSSIKVGKKTVAAPSTFVPFDAAFPDTNYYVGYLSSVDPANADLAIAVYPVRDADKAVGGFTCRPTDACIITYIAVMQ